MGGQDGQSGPGGSGGAGGSSDPGGQGGQDISLDDMPSENIWFLGSKSSNYQGNLRCHARDGRTNGRTYERTEESGK